MYFARHYQGHLMMLALSSNVSEKTLLLPNCGTVKINKTLIVTITLYSLS